MFIILSLFTFSASTTYALDFSIDATAEAGKPFTISVGGCSEQARQAANITGKDSAGNFITQWGPVFAFQEISLGKTWHAELGKFDKNGTAKLTLTLENANRYNFRFSCTGTSGKDPTDFSGRGEPDLHDHIGSFIVRSHDEVTNKVQPVCQLDADGYCRNVNTAIGQIDTDPVKLITQLVSVFLGLSGGIFLLLVIRAGYRLIASQGNPEAIKDARESLISAIVGFLFLIFSFVILELIGVHILQLPGWGA